MSATLEHPAEACWLCGDPTPLRALYAPTDVSGGWVFKPGVFVFPLCRECAPKFSLDTPEVSLLVSELRQLALGGRSA
jgi:hypothetical protein